MDARPDTLNRLRQALGDRYEIDRELGHGGMATVYLAKDLKHSRDVAIKVLLPDLAASVGAERFLREIGFAARIRHPHIVPLYDSGDADGLLYYVMPHLVGESLRTRLDRDKQLPIDEALRIANEVADALSHAHAQGVVHRDIKPDNIMLEAGHVVVTDFGIAKAVASTEATITETGLTVGTPAYMSPEQAAGDKDVDGRSDLYALACVLYEMLAGRTPFVGPTAASVIQQHMTLESVPLTALRPAVPAEVSAAVTRAMAKSPADRFNPVAQFSEVLRARSATGTGAATPVAVAGAAARPHIASRVLAIAVVVVIALAGAWMARDRLGAGQPVIESLAVLPLENLSGDASQEYFVNGVHDALIGELSKLAGLRVTSRTSALAFKGSTLTLPAIADSLGVDAVIEGSVFRSGDTVRLQVQLIGAKPERHLWSQSYDRDVRDVLATMGNIVSAVAGEVRVALSAREQQQLASRGAVNPVAQEHFLRGKQLVYRRDSIGLVDGIAELRLAYRADSAFAPTSAALALAYHLMNVVLAKSVEPDAAYSAAARGLALANRAIALDSTLAEASAVRGYMTTFYGGPLADAERDLRRAIELQPGNAEAHGWLAQALAPQSRRYDEAVAAIQRAVAIDPVSPGMRVAHAAVADIGAQWNDALQHGRLLRSLRPDLWFGLHFKVRALAHLGRFDECLSLLRPGGVPSPVEPVCLHGMGRRDEAARAASSGLLPSDPAIVDYHLLAGDKAAALRAMDRAIARKPFSNPMSDNAAALLIPPGEFGQFREQYEAVRSRAWARIVQESRTAMLP
jgi:serine/threonine-protein kinase